MIVAIISVLGGFTVAIIAIVTKHNRKKKVIRELNKASNEEKIRALSEIIKDYPTWNDDSMLKFGSVLFAVGFGLLAGAFMYYRLEWIPQAWLAYLIGASITSGLAFLFVSIYNKKKKTKH
ncbi:MAG: hypothetical protein OXE77_09450 [Flavobacteriaceae bacterium]|nr:hypothetical protein [Flavobacteriaceae bacterium]MCY4266593.1 hypothetical protein [Flavobacteriaceae bacterium]MCY4297980.1 hypothetical protein [Flavobacteriaceae bacterium]